MDILLKSLYGQVKNPICKSCNSVQIQILMFSSTLKKDRKKIFIMYQLAWRHNLISDDFGPLEQFRQIKVDLEVTVSLKNKWALWQYLQSRIHHGLMLRYADLDERKDDQQAKTIGGKVNANLFSTATRTMMRNSLPFISHRLHQWLILQNLPATSNCEPYDCLLQGNMCECVCYYWYISFTNTGFCLVTLIN